MITTLDIVVETITVSNDFLADILQAIEDINQAGSGKGQKSKADEGSDTLAEIAKIVLAIGTVVFALVKFAEALDPGTVQAFSQAMSNLFAVIGQAVLPIFQVLTGVLNQVSGILSTTFAGLAPILRIVSQVAGLLIIDLAKLVAALAPILNILTPLLEMIANVVESWSVGFALLAAIIKTVVNTILGLFGGGLQNAADSFRSAMQKFTNAVIIAIGALLKFLGLNELLGNFIEALKPAPAAGVAAAGETALRSFEEVSRQISINAARASGGLGEKDKSLDLSEGIKGLLKIQEEDADKLDDILDRLGEIGEGIRDIADFVEGFSTGFAQPFQSIFGGGRPDPHPARPGRADTFDIGGGGDF